MGRECLGSVPIISLFRAFGPGSIESHASVQKLCHAFFKGPRYHIVRYSIPAAPFGNLLLWLLATKVTVKTYDVSTALYSEFLPIYILGGLSELLMEETFVTLSLTGRRSKTQLVSLLAIASC